VELPGNAESAARNAKEDHMNTFPFITLAAASLAAAFWLGAHCAFRAVRKALKEQRAQENAQKCRDDDDALRLGAPLEGADAAAQNAGVFYCQNCSYNLVDRQGDICRWCRDFLAGRPHA
jgi:hypothetical protein